MPHKHIAVDDVLISYWYHKYGSDQSTESVINFIDYRIDYNFNDSPNSGYEIYVTLLFF